MSNQWRRSLRLIRLGALGHLRNPAFRLLGVLVAAGTAIYAWNQGPLAGSLAVVLSLGLGRVYGVAACLWFAYAAVRDQNDQVGAVLRSKPVDGAYWVFLNWASGMVLWLALLGAAFLAAAVAQLPHAGVNSLLAHGLGFARAALVLLIVGTLSFGMSRLFRSPLGGVMTMFAWFCAIGGLANIPLYLQPDYSQNRALFLAAAGLVLGIAGLVVERFRRGELRQPLVPAVIVAGLALLTAGGTAQAYRALPRLNTGEGSFWDTIAAQHLQIHERVPGFWLPDGRGGQVRTAEHHGKILLVYLFDAADLESARTLAALQTIHQQYRDRGVLPIAVAQSANHGDGPALARAGGYSYPVASDVSTLKTAPPPQSATTIAYDVQLLPTLVVTDRRRRAREIVRDRPSIDATELRRLVEERLQAEPQ